MNWPCALCTMSLTRLGLFGVFSIQMLWTTGCKSGFIFLRHMQHVIHQRKAYSTKSQIDLPQPTVPQRCVTTSLLFFPSRTPFDTCVASAPHGHLYTRLPRGADR